MSKDATLYTRIDEKDKNAFEHFVKTFGLSTSQAIRIFIKQTLLLNAFPFKVGIPNKETEKAFREGEDPKNLSSYTSFKKLREELDV